MKFAITRDPALLAQYYAIREAGFQQDLGLEHFDGSEDAWDAASDILVILDQGRCIGGVRITGRRQPGVRHLPVESEGLDLDALAPEGRLKRPDCCQWSRLVVAPAYRNPSVFAAFVAQVKVHTEALGYAYGLIVTGVNQARLYRRLFGALGVRLELHPEVAVPAEAGFKGLPHLLGLVRLPVADAAWRQVA